MFALGLGLGLLVAAVVVLGLWLMARHEPPLDLSYRAHATIHDIERQAIHAMLAAELATQQATHAHQDRQP